jgi:PEGA domain
MSEHNVRFGNPECEIGGLTRNSSSSLAAEKTSGAPAVRGRIARGLSRLVALLLLLSFTAPAAAASDANGDDPQLEAPIQQGIALRRAGNDEAALTLFLDLEKSNPESIRVLLHITAAAQATGRWLMAYSYLRKAGNHKNEPYFVRYRSAIKSIEDATAQHVGQFRAVGSPAGAQVRLNGAVVGTLPMTDPKPIEVGQYALEVTKEGFYPLRRSVSIGAGTALTQEAVELREGTPGADPMAVGGRVGGTSGGRGALERPPWWHARWVTWTLAGATAVTAATSVVALVRRNARADHWNSRGCLDGTRTRQDVCGGVRDEISLAQGVAIGSGIAAVVFGGLTLTQAIVSSERAPVAAAKAPSVSCSFGLASVGCFGSF